MPAVIPTINEFLEAHCSFERSSKTKKAYALDLSQFAKTLPQQCEIRGIVAEHIERWLLSLKGEGYATSSIRRKVAALKVFFKHCFRRQLIASNPFQRVALIHGRQRVLTKVLTEQDMRRLLETARKAFIDLEQMSVVVPGKCFRAARDRALVELLFATGVRIGEAANLQISDIDIENRQLAIRGKGNRDRLAFITDAEAWRAVACYMECRAKISPITSALFINRCRSALSTQGMANAICRVARLARIEKHISPHMLRHTSATLLLKSDVDIRVVQEFLGHASISTTQRYTHISKTHLVELLSNRHPSLRLREQS